MTKQILMVSFLVILGIAYREDVISGEWATVSFLVASLWWCISLSKRRRAVETDDSDDGGDDLCEDEDVDGGPQMWNGWALLVQDCPVFEAKEIAERLDVAGIRCKLEVLHEDRAFHRHGNFGMGTRMCVLVSPSEYERAMRLVADFVLGKDKCD